MNMQQMIQNMQRAKAQYDKEHKKIEETVFEYTASGAVTVKIKGTLEIQSIEILDDDLLSDKEGLQDLIKIAFNGCKDKIMEAEDELASKFQKTGLM